MSTETENRTKEDGDEGLVNKKEDMEIEIKLESEKEKSIFVRIKNYFKNEKKLLTLLTFIGVAVGFIVGFILNPYSVSDSALLWIGLPGELYMRMLKAVILPLIVSSVIVGAASVDPKSNGKISGIAITYIIITNLAGSLFGLVFALIIRPGSGQVIQMDTGIPDTHLQTEDIFADLIRNLFPENIVASTFQKTQTNYNRREFPLMKNISGVMTNSTITSYSRAVGIIPGTNILGLIILCALLGMAAGKNREAGAPFIKFFDATEKIISQVLNWIIW